MKTVGEALNDKTTTLGRSAAAHEALVQRVAAMTEAEQAEFWRAAAKATA